MRPQIVTILLFFVSLFSTFSATAQLTGGGNPPPPPPTTTPPPELSLDNAILFLLLAGILYGVYAAVKKIKATHTPG